MFGLLYQHCADTPPYTTLAVPLMRLRVRTMPLNTGVATELTPPHRGSAFPVTVAFMSGGYLPAGLRGSSHSGYISVADW